MKAPISILRPGSSRDDDQRTGFGRIASLIAPKLVESDLGNRQREFGEVGKQQIDRERPGAG